MAKRTMKKTILILISVLILISFPSNTEAISGGLSYNCTNVTIDVCIGPDNDTTMAAIIQ